jgi:hypothetical protein
MQSLVRCVLATFFLALALPAIAAEDFRAWTDSTGDFKLEAKFISSTTTAVRLLQNNGESFEIPLDKLSKANQEYVKKISNPSNPFKKTVKKNPFQKSSKGSSTGTGATLTSKLVKVNLASADLISLVPESDEWKYQPPADNQLGFKPKNVSLPPKKSQGPSYHLYDSVVLPKFLQNPTGGKGARAQQTLGTSQIAAHGIK